MRTYIYYIGVLLLTLGFQSQTNAQFKLKGTVYDSTKNYPLELVTVMSTSGKGTSTNAWGEYVIEVREEDSVWFSYLNKPTKKYSVAKIQNSEQFDIALHVNIPVLKEVIVRRRSYRMDSLQNRIDYAKGFNFTRPNLETMTSIGPNGAGIDINELIRVFQFRKNRSMEMFRERLLQQERDKYIEYRFNKALVRRLTSLTGSELDSFMALYRPSYEFAITAPEYEFQSYIRNAYAEFRKKNEQPKGF